MRGAILSVAFTAFLLFPGLASAEDLTTVSDLELLVQTREAVRAQDADAALSLLTEMQRRGIGLFAQQEMTACKDVIDLPEGISDWRFRGAARQAYITTAKARRVEASSCACLFAGFSFDQFAMGMLQKPATDLVDADRTTFEAFLAAMQSDTDAQYRALDRSCRMK